jgi:hypothetical protein
MLNRRAEISRKLIRGTKMGVGFSAYKAMAVMILAAVAIAFAAPDLPANFDRLRTGIESSGILKKSKSGSTSTTTTTTTTTTSTSTTTSGGTNLAYPELSMISSNFDVSTDLVASWGAAAIPVSNAPDVVGAFRFICGAGQILYDDPIVSPGQPGASHLHQYYGNTGANAYSTYSTLRSSGDSTCGNAVNRSGYWMPAMMVGKTYVLKPDYVSIYYKRRPASDPKCSLTSGDPQAEGNCIPLPNGLRFIFGYDMISSTPATGSFHFACVVGSTPTATSGTLVGIANAGCAVGSHIEALIGAPECWDGQNLDSANHRSHVSYPSYGSWGYLKCDSGHPFVIPTFTLAAFYQVTPEVETALLALKAGAPWDYTKMLHLSSDEMMPTLVPGTTFHADWFGGWDNTVMSMWIDNCINKLLNCSGGDLGNGLQIKGAAQPSYGWSNPQPLVPVPAKP